MSPNLLDRRAVVCGGSRGIGRAIALAFAAEGAHVSICARGADGLEAARAAIAAAGSGHGVTVHAAACDLGHADQIAAYIAAAAKVLGGIDILVNNASGFGAGDTEEAWAKSVSVDIMATVRASRAAEPFLEASTVPAIVNISSISGLEPSNRTPAYGAAKAAVIHYTMTQASVLARKGIRVNCVAPGSIEFPGGVWDKRKSSDPALYGRIQKSIPFGRLGTPEEVANVVLFLASPRAGWVTGQTISVDGAQMLG